MPPPKLKMSPLKVLSGNPEPGLSIEEVQFIDRFLHLADILLETDIEHEEDREAA
jgi:hypothetical protein